MSLYNMLFGINPLSRPLLDFLGLNEVDFYRFRDCYLKDGQIFVHTRGGGGNRTCHCEPAKITNRVVREDQVHDSSCVVFKHGCIRKHSNYIRDYDEEFGDTYATFVFSVPEEHKLAVELFQAGMDPNALVDPEAKWKMLFTALDSGKMDSKAARNALAVGKKIFAAIDGGEDQIVEHGAGAVEVKSIKAKGK